MPKEFPRIRLAHIVDEITPAGKETGIVKLARSLNPARFECLIVALSGIQAFGVMNLEGLDIVSLDKNQGNDWLLPLRLTNLFKNRRIDIVHTHSWGTLAEGVIAAKLAGVPGIIHGEHGSFPGSWRRRQAQKILWRFPDRLLSVSRDLRSRLSDTVGFPEERIEVILNGVDEERFFPCETLGKQFRKDFNFLPGDFIVGTVGRFSAVKNQRMLLLAAAELIGQGEIVHVALVSKGHLERELKELSRSLGIPQFVHFLGFQSDVNKVLNGFDIFALTSVSEGCSNVIQEAMFCAKPVIATHVGGNPELIEDNRSGLLVESNNSLQLAEKIRFLKHHPAARERLGENARQRALKNFTLKKMIRAYEELYLQEYFRKKIIA